jgi:hypothetical protein
LGKHASGGTDSVERVCLATRAALATQPSDLEHRLAVFAQEAREPGTVGTGALDRKRSPPLSVLVGERQHFRVAAAIGVNTRLTKHAAAAYLHDRERVTVAVRVDANDVVH